MWPLRSLGSVVALIGMSSVLYALGFMVLRSHDAFFGLWGGIKHDSSDIAEEGGRFLLHSFMSFLDFFSWKSISNHILFSVFTIIAIAFLGLSTKKIEGLTLPESSFSKSITTILFFIFSGFIILLSWFYLEALAILISYRNILSDLNTHEKTILNIISNPHESYMLLFRRLISLIILLCIFYKIMTFNKTTTFKYIGYFLSMLIIAGTCLLPAAYGRLIYTPEYPLIKTDDSEKTERLLIRSSGSHWMLWNTAIDNVEIVHHSLFSSIQFAEKKSLIEIFQQKQLRKKGSHVEPRDQ